jgi:hypothetical protein
MTIHPKFQTLYYNCESILIKRVLMQFQRFGARSTAVKKIATNLRKETNCVLWLKKIYMWNEPNDVLGRNWKRIQLLTNPFTNRSVRQAAWMDLGNRLDVSRVTNSASTEHTERRNKFRSYSWISTCSTLQLVCLF